MLKQGMFSTLAMLTPAGAALAQPVSCGFDSPAFHLGALHSQNGWNVSPGDVPGTAANVVSTPRFAGDHAARFDQAVYFSEFYVDWPCNVAISASQNSLDVEWRMNITLGSGFGWVVDLLASNNIRLGWLWIDGGNMWYRVWSNEPQLASAFMTSGVWHAMKITLDWQARTTEFFMDGQSIAFSGWRQFPSRDVGLFELRAVVGGSSDVAYLDSLLLTPHGTCAADFNNDGVANSQDFFDYLNEFFAGRPAADFNQDGVVNSQDFFDFLQAFFAGC